MRRDIDRLSQRIKTVEGKAEKTRKELEKVKGQVDEVMTLGPKIDELSQLVEAQRQAQDVTNASILSDIAILKHSGPNVENQLKYFTSEIANLTQRYWYLYKIANDLINSTPASNPVYRDFVPTSNINAMGNPERKNVLAY